MEKHTHHGRLVIDDGKERHATWLELFFDLVFVVTVSGLSRHLMNRHHLIGVIEYVFLFLVVWWQWMGMSYYADQFKSEDGVGHFSLFAVMLGIVFLNVCLPHAFSTYIKPFAIIYIVLRLILILLYARSYYDTPESRELTKKYILGFSIAAFCWFLSLFFNNDTVFFLWAIGMMIDIFTPPYAYLTAKHVPAHVSHMDERFGLFVLIVLGETIVDVSHNLMLNDRSLPHIIMTIIGFFVIIGFWRLYFSKNAENIIHNALRKKGKSLFLSFVYGYGHLLIFISIVAFGAGIQLFAIKNPQSHSDGLRIMIGSILLFFISNFIIQKAAERTLKDAI